MLVLSRKRDEKIKFTLENGEEIELTVVKIDSNKVKLGIEASNSVTILRSELETAPKAPKLSTIH
jgi:carbon storage regulator CsrA